MPRKRSQLVGMAKRADAVSLAYVSVHVLFVALPVWLGAMREPGFHLVFLWLWFGLTMNGLLNLMHESAHYLTFRRRWACDFLGRWILGPLALADFDGYRARHWRHHTRFGESDDTKDAYLINIGGWNLATLLARSLLGFEAIRKLRHQSNGTEMTAPGRNSIVALLRICTTQGLFFGFIFAVADVGHPGLWQALVRSSIAYLGVYLYGLASLTVLAANLRAIAEHQIGDDPAPRVGRASLRNFSCNPFTRLVLGAYGFGEHGTHHFEPAIPYYHLQGATDELAAADMALRPSRGYIMTLVTLICRRTPLVPYPPRVASPTDVKINSEG
jgi:fatty acid desaturase